jgi:ATP-dependent RNA helicase DeaD
MTQFESVVPALGQALSNRGYLELTPVQQAVLVPELREADALVSAQTGSGKTVAFGLALAPALLDGADRFSHINAPLALVVAPTRELALQVKRELEWLYEMTGAALASCVGGMDMRAERRVLGRGVHIVVGTPGRLRDHIERGSLDMTALKAVVLDEADEMLDLGFRDDLEYILEAAPSKRRTLMFSATVPRSIAALAKRYQRDAVRVTTTAEQKQHRDIEYRALTVAPSERENAIVNVLRYFEAKNALVFCGTRAAVRHMTSRFANRGFSVVALSGELSQSERTHSLQALRDGRARVCIATDVAARGIDLPNLDLVVQRKRTGQLLNSANVEAAWGSPPSVDEIMNRDRERILTHPSLSEPLNDDEQSFAEELLARHGAEQVAAAFVRQHLAGQSAPEELLVSTPSEAKKKTRDDFRGSVWFSLSVGRDQGAEQRWLLPMLCRAGHLTKNEIGRIKINQSDTHVELVPQCVERFLAAVGPSGKVEKTISVTQLDGPGQLSKANYGNKRPNTRPRPRSRLKLGAKGKFEQKPGTPPGRVKTLG